MIGKGVLHNVKLSSSFFDQPSARLEKAPSLKTEDVIMCCLDRNISYLRGVVIDEYGTMVEY
jgi:hypothetical protein